MEKETSQSSVNSFYKDWVSFSTRNFPELKKHKSNFKLFNEVQFRELFKKAPSVSTHRKNMLEKTGTKNTTELLNLSLVKGLL